ncbi:MAG: hypothetical protein KME63_15945 [Candidatus Thiodiazotropha sp. (ex Clathrolucina costata)]|nr:hypothetical protein [Candidatus Thiodiazotropha taylori]MCG7863607.1 hypothetical protein [Candidatus Thiodiazotropha endolucinida]
MTKSKQNQASLDQALLRAEQQLFQTGSLLAVLRTAVFDLEATPFGEPMDSAAWSDVMAILHQNLKEVNEQLAPFCMNARERIREAVKSEEAQS